MARGKGEHGVYQRANGRWVASVEAGYTVTGRKRRTALATMSAGATQSRASLRPPWPSRVMSSRFWI